MTQTMNIFELRISALGPSSGRYRSTHPEQPMSSAGADWALDDMIDECKKIAEQYGFTIVRSGYGVRATHEIE